MDPHNTYWQNGPYCEVQSPIVALPLAEGRRLTVRCKSRIVLERSISRGLRYRTGSQCILLYIFHI